MGHEGGPLAGRDARHRGRGRVALVFQPAEELLEGAAAMIADGAAEGLDLAIGFHNQPDMPVGRFGYARETCAAIARSAREPWHGLAPALPVPAGGMRVERVPEMRRAFGDDTMLLIGGDLLVAGGDLEVRCRAFVAAVRESADVS